tara:strand:- start:225 stop:671 length:447 start_codon:yes stop_codon:yes gene_type:complete
MSRKKTILAPENTRVERTENSGLEFSEHSRETKTAFNEKVKKLISSILNYPTQFLISIYIVVHSSVTISHLFDGNFFVIYMGKFKYFKMSGLHDEAIFIGFITTLFLFLVFRFYYQLKLKSILIYSLFFNFGSMLLFVICHSIYFSGA